MSENYWQFNRQALLDAGLDLQTVEAIGSAVERNMDDYVTLSYAGDPNNNINSNFSLLCIDSTNDFLYYNLTVGDDTWTKVVV